MRRHAPHLPRRADHARSCSAVVVYLGFTKTNPFAEPLRASRPRSPTCRPSRRGPRCASPASRSARSRASRCVGDGRSAAGIVTIEINDKGLPIHSDATLKIRPRLFLEGNYFVDVEPGSPSAPELEDGATLPATQTAAPVGIGEVLDALQSRHARGPQDGPARVRRCARGRAAPRRYNRSITLLGAGLQELGAVVTTRPAGILEHDLSELHRRVRHGRRRPGPLPVAPARADHQPGPDRRRRSPPSSRTSAAAIGELPRTLRQGHRALGHAQRRVPAVAPARRRADARGPRSPAVARRAAAVRPAAARPVHQAPSCGSLASELRDGRARARRPQQGRRGAPGAAARALELLGRTSISPWQEDTIVDPNFTSAGKVYEEGVKWLPGIAGESRNSDANGQWVKHVRPERQLRLRAGRRAGSSSPSCRVQGVNPPKAADRRRCAPTCRARPRSRRTCARKPVRRRRRRSRSTRTRPGARQRAGSPRARRSQSLDGPGAARSPLGDAYTLSNELLQRRPDRRRRRRAEGGRLMAKAIRDHLKRHGRPARCC